MELHERGRPAPGLGTWRTYAEVADIFRGPADPEWQHDRDLLDQRLRDPWARPDDSARTRAR